MDESRLRPLLRVLLAPGVTSAAAARLLRAYGDDPERVLAAGREAASIPGVGPAVAAALASGAASPADAAGEAARARDLGAALVGRDDDGYPRNLRQSYDPPPLLWVRGAWTPADDLSVAVVGARRASPYGLVQAGRFARAFVRAGVSVASGAARGVDTAAHRAALEEPEGRTVAVLGSGHARPYPPENARLLDLIAARGAVLSEFPLDAPPLPHHFPLRNRVIAGVSMATLVVEAGEKSGSLVTARICQDVERPVFAVPGRVDAPGSRGVHRLIRENFAALAESPEDVLEALEIAPAEAAATAAADGPAGRVLAALDGAEALDADEVSRAAGLPVGEARALLVDLELDGAVLGLPGGRWCRK
ncbi:MAG TPA: DNA-processing protein DprA [Planctomycetota bacterium]|nr:DNA-processing protein DprA [Planctomycetota bacterium]